MSAPDLVEPVIGWRCWMLKKERLTSITGRGHIKPRQLNTATCTPENPTHFVHHYPTTTHYYVNMWLPAAPGTHYVVGLKTFQVVNTTSGTNANGWTISTAAIPGGNVYVPERPPDPRRCRTPEYGCHCGYFAYKDEEALIEQGYDHGMYEVWGKVALWGKLIEHEIGYRAQHLYPVELWTSRGEKTANHLSNIYGVPVHSTQEALGDTFPQEYDPPGLHRNLGKTPEMGRKARFEQWLLVCPAWQAAIAFIVTVFLLAAPIIGLITGLEAVFG